MATCDEMKMVGVIEHQKRPLYRCMTSLAHGAICKRNLYTKAHDCEFNTVIQRTSESSIPREK